MIWTPTLFSWPRGLWSPLSWPGFSGQNRDPLPKFGLPCIIAWGRSWLRCGCFRLRWLSTLRSYLKDQWSRVGTCRACRSRQRGRQLRRAWLLPPECTAAWCRRCRRQSLRWGCWTWTWGGGSGWGEGYLSVLSEQIDEVVGVGGESWNNAVEVLVDGVDLFGDLTLLEEEGGLVLFGGEDDPLLGDDAWMREGVPMAEPVLLMAYTAYSICWRRPSGVKVVVLESYLLLI